MQNFTFAWDSTSKIVACVLGILVSDEIGPLIGTGETRFSLPESKQRSDII